MPQTLEHPLAYHITFGTYGTRLHGNPLGTIDRTNNHPGDPIIGHNTQWERIETNRLNHKPVFLSKQQRHFTETQLPQICQRGQWDFHIAAAQPNHVHALISSLKEGKTVRRWLKQWLTESLNQRWPHNTNKVWWAECGSIRWVWNERYLQSVYNYILDQRLTP